MSHILVVEDDEFFRTALKNILESQGHRVTEAENGKNGRDIIMVSEPFDIVLSDIQMPFLTGVELLQWVKENKPMPFILMTGFALVMETQKAHELGADDFLAKPFGETELLTAISRFQPQKPGPIEQPKDEVEYCKVSLDEFVSTPRIMFDVYVYLGNRYVKIGRKGDEIPRDRIQNYREKGLKFLHIEKKDFPKLIGFSVELAKTLSATAAVNPEKKANFLRYTGELILENAFNNDIDKLALVEAKDFLITSLDALIARTETFDLLSILNTHTDSLYAHSMCVSLYAIMIAKKMGFTSTQNLFRLGMCGIFHDIGMKELDREILEKPRALLTIAERNLLESHPSRGRDILIEMEFMPSEVAQVAYEHHENIIGTGFPRRIGKNQMHPFSLIVKTADVFASQVIKKRDRPSMEPRAAIDFIHAHHCDELDTDSFRALRTLVRERKPSTTAA